MTKSVRVNIYNFDSLGYVVRSERKLKCFLTISNQASQLNQQLLLLVLLLLNLLLVQQQLLLNIARFFSVSCHDIFFQRY